MKANRRSKMKILLQIRYNFNHFGELRKTIILVLVYSVCYYFYDFYSLRWNLVIIVLLVYRKKVSLGSIGSFFCYDGADRRGIVIILATPTVYPTPMGVG